MLVRIGIVGDFNRANRSHWATEAALFHAAARAGVAVEPRWLATLAVSSAEGARLLLEVDGIWGAPGSPFASEAGMIAGIRHARENDVPYLGTCAGFQYALIEFTRNVLGIADANSAENDPDAPNVVITPVECAVPTAGAEGPRLSGESVARPIAETLFQRLCGDADLRGEYFCSLEANPEFAARWQAAGLRPAARGADGEMRAFELPSNRFFLATLFQPQLSSSFAQPHPLIVGYLRACADGRR